MNNSDILNDFQMLENRLDFQIEILLHLECVALLRIHLSVKTRCDGQRRAAVAREARCLKDGCATARKPRGGERQVGFYVSCRVSDSAPALLLNT